MNKKQENKKPNLKQYLAWVPLAASLVFGCLIAYYRYSTDPNQFEGFPAVDLVLIFLFGPSIAFVSFGTLSSIYLFYLSNNKKKYWRWFTILFGIIFIMGIFVLGWSIRSYGEWKKETALFKQQSVESQSIGPRLLNNAKSLHDCERLAIKDKNFYYSFWEECSNKYSKTDIDFPECSRQINIIDPDNSDKDLICRLAIAKNLSDIRQCLPPKLFYDYDTIRCLRFTEIVSGEVFKLYEQCTENGRARCLLDALQKNTMDFPVKITNSHIILNDLRKYAPIICSMIDATAVLPFSAADQIIYNQYCLK